MEERVIDEIERMRAAGASNSKSRPHTDPTHMDARMASFYHFSELPDPEAFASDLKERCAAQSVLGRVLVAREGINGAVVGAPQSVDEVMTWMQSVDALRGLRYRTCSVARPGMDRSPFHRLQVRLKKEIITMGGRELGVSADGTDVLEQNETRVALDMSHSGEHVSPTDWDDLISRDDVLLLGT